jgi:hypothetical protein
MKGLSCAFDTLPAYKYAVIDATHARGKELAPGHREAVHGMDDQGMTILIPNCQ